MKDNIPFNNSDLQTGEASVDPMARLLLGKAYLDLSEDEEDEKREETEEERE